MTISLPIILSIHRWSLYHLKKCRMDNQIYISQLSASLFFYKLLFEVNHYSMANKTWLKNALHFTFWDRIFAHGSRVVFSKSSFFIPSFRHQDSNSYYSVVATAKIPKKLRPWTSIFQYTNLKIVPLIASELSTETYRLSVRHFNFVIARNTL